jgi:hypothetical protein
MSFYILAFLKCSDNIGIVLNVYRFTHCFKQNTIFLKSISRKVYFKIHVMNSCKGIKIFCYSSNILQNIYKTSTIIM